MNPNRLPPELLAEFAFVEWLGKGATSVVYLGRQQTLNRNVVVKLLAAPQADLEARFLREAQVLAGLDHPGISKLVDYGQAGGRLYLATLFEPGTSLAAVMEQRKRLPWREAARIARDVAEALAAAHAAGIVHRDVKPGNILISPDGKAKLIDFGFSRTAESKLTAEGEYIGTPAYSAPEHCFSGVCTPLSDLYSLGVVLYEMLTGANPFRGSSPNEAYHLQLTHEVKELPADSPEVPEDLRALALSMLEKTAQDRPPSTREVAAKLGALLRGVRSRPVRPVRSRPAAPVDGTVRMTTRPVEKSRKPWAAAAVLALVALGLWLRPGTTSTPAVKPVEAKPVTPEPSGVTFELSASGRVQAVSMTLPVEAQARLEEDGLQPGEWSTPGKSHRLPRVLSGPKDRFLVVTQAAGQRFQLGPFEGYLPAALAAGARNRLEPYLKGIPSEGLRLGLGDRALLHRHVELARGLTGSREPIAIATGGSSVAVPPEPLARWLALDVKLAGGPAAPVEVRGEGMTQTVTAGQGPVELDPAMLASRRLQVVSKAGVRAMRLLLYE